MKLTALSTSAIVVFSSVAFAETMPGEALLLLDGDGDGLVTYEEFSSQMDTLFGGMDTDQNGRLERGEVESFMSGDVFDAADTNRDGRISKGEYDVQIRKDFEGADRDGDGSLD